MRVYLVTALYNHNAVTQVILVCRYDKTSQSIDGLNNDVSLSNARSPSNQSALSVGADNSLVITNVSQNNGHFVMVDNLDHEPCSAV